MFQVTFDKEEKCDENQEADQDFIASFVMRPVQSLIAPVHKYRSHDKCYQEKYREYKLALRKHFFFANVARLKAIRYFAILKSHKHETTT